MSFPSTIDFVDLGSSQDEDQFELFHNNSTDTYNSYVSALNSKPTCANIISEGNQNQNFCYLLRSISSKNSFYIGYTKDPQKRIEQHNGIIKNGAKKTIRSRPWSMECIVTGFPEKVVALQFEWIWQNPGISKRSRSIFESCISCQPHRHNLKEKNLSHFRLNKQTAIRRLKQSRSLFLHLAWMIYLCSMHPFNNFPLSVYFMNDNTFTFYIDKVAPWLPFTPSTQTYLAPLETFKFKHQIVEVSNSEYTHVIKGTDNSDIQTSSALCNSDLIQKKNHPSITPTSLISLPQSAANELTCSYCLDPFLYDNLLRKKAHCPKCNASYHLTCLARSNEPSTIFNFIPSSIFCYCCLEKSEWKQCFN